MEQITEEGAKKSRLVEKGELILANSMSFGATYEVGVSGCIYDGWFVLREYEDNFIKNFLLQQLNTYEQQKQYSRLSAGGVVKNISSGIVYETILKRPSKKEQQKIADCLSSIDDLISAEEKKLSLLNDYKKGWMQRLFPKEGKTVPRWRFPEFRNCVEWEEKKIGTFGEIINGLSGKKGTDFGNGEPYIQYKQVFDKSYIDFSECGKVSIKNDEIQNAVQKGDILFTTSSETPDEVGFASVVVNKPHKKTYLNSFCFILRPFDLENTIPIFFSFLFQSSVYRRSVSAIAQGSTRYNLSRVVFRKLKIPIPPKPEEQQKIANFLSGIDELIIRQTDKIEALKQHKQALMQGLFPATEEVL